MSSQEVMDSKGSAAAIDATALAEPLRERDVTAASRSFARRRRRQLIAAGIIAVAIALLPLVLRDIYLRNVLILTLMYAALSQSWNILGGYCGQISLGHAIYFGLGAYASTLLYIHLGVTPWLGMLAGGTGAALLALILGYPFFRLRGHYFTIATIVVAEAGLILMINWDFAGGAQGIQIPYGPDSWLHLQFARDKLPYIYFSLGFAVLTWLASFIIEDSRWGYWWRAVKDNAEAAESLGVDVFRSKMAAAALSAFFTAIGGGFYAAFVSYIDPDSVMGFQFSLLIALPAVLGGIGTLWGPSLGAAVLIPLTELTRSYLGGSGSGFDLIIYGGLIMMVALARPAGLTSLLPRPSAAGPAQ
jgi:branched-chain amino acid transport system permease protein